MEKRSPNVRARIRRLNPNGIELGSVPRGWHPHKRSFSEYFDALTPKRFIKLKGRHAYRSLPKIRHDGHRKRIPYRLIEA
jgi:hypothetical protein